ncbi:MAG: uncharacterized protein JWL95_1910 [Gemmatimonadetes bacterium]|nr:uncharacterized protein [Gemmatimonadota bacterium]
MPPVSSAHDSPIGRWTHTRWQPSFLRGAVEMIWYFDGSTAFRREHVFPNGLLELVFSLDGPRFVVEHDGRALECPDANVSGLQLRPMVVVSPSDRTRVFGIRLHPAAASAVLGRALPDLVSTTAALRDVVGPSANELAERCHAAQNPDVCVRIAARWIAARLRAAPPPDQAIDWVIRQIEESSGRIPIATLRERAGLSRNRLASAFRDQMGVAPKSYARIRRFDRAMRLMQTRPVSLSTLALDAGYYDQSHLTAEFRSLADRTPASFAAALRYPESLNLAER